MVKKKPGIRLSAQHMRMPDFSAVLLLRMTTSLQVAKRHLPVAITASPDANLPSSKKLT
jgi:hypothetical protein